ncbi:hypothetical protein [Streptomyces sp. NPDC005303]|uniref:hypothetical protein n=1 Tax=Streptomyces sp. NPDC005303 TaxID=3155713 RepID=UPI0033B4BE89
MQRMRGEEKWVQACLQAALPGIEVRRHDDGSQPGMHDFDLIRGIRRFAAVEVTAAADATLLELWKIMNGGGRWIHDGLAGGWLVTLLPSARAKRLRAELPGLLAELERMGAQQLREAHGPGEDIVDRAERLGVVSVYQSPATDFPGSIYCTIDLPPEQSGGWVADTGDAFSHWVSSWLREPSQADNLGKLRRSGATERHLFLLLPGFTTAPFDAFDPLMRPDGPLPVVAPSLPEEITHLWAMSTWNTGDGFHWAPDTGWTRFHKVNDVEPPP